LKRLGAMLAVVVLVVVGVGFYRGWFTLSNPRPAAGSSQLNVNLATDTDKMKQDAKSVKDKAAELTGKVQEGFGESTARSSGDALPKDPEPNDVPPKSE
jgi:hypothetical protein